jgi:hypothetical protein
LNAIENGGVMSDEIGGTPARMGHSGDAARSRYSRPSLKAYGRLTELTAAGSQMSAENAKENDQMNKP